MRQTMAAVMAVLLMGEWAAAKSIAVTKFEEIDDAGAAYEARCVRGQTNEDECRSLRALLYLALEDELRVMQWTNTEDNIEPAIRALRVPDRDVQLRALQVIGKWPQHPEVQQAVRPFLLDASPLQAYTAAKILERSPDQGVARVAKQLLANRGPTMHSGTLPLYAGAEHPNFAEHGLQKYPHSTPLDLADVYADGYRAAGFATTDPVEQVLAFYRGATGQNAMDRAEFDRRRAASQQAVEGKLAGNAKLKEIEALAKKFAETMAPAILTRVEELSKEITASASADIIGEALFKLPPPPGHSGDPALEGGHYFFVATKNEVPVQMVLVYVDDYLARTVIQLAWALVQ